MTKVAILIDGGFLLKRLPSVRKEINSRNPENVSRAIGQLIFGHLKHLAKQEKITQPFSLLYRCFYYDAKPYTAKAHMPISKKPIDYSKTDEAIFRQNLFTELRKRPSFAVRLGEVRRERSWILNSAPQKELLAGDRNVSDLTDSDFSPGLRQKAVDMRIGIDIASLTLKKQVDTIVLVAGDSDFVPAAKLARREGVKIILDPLWQSVTPDLFEHIDGLRAGFSSNKNKGTDSE